MQQRALLLHFTVQTLAPVTLYRITFRTGLVFTPTGKNRSVYTTPLRSMSPRLFLYCH